MMRINGKTRMISSIPLCLAMIISMVLVQGGEAYTPVTYDVGGSEGWDLSISMQSWANSKKFFTGDRLRFKYDDQRFDVAVVKQAGFNSCTVGDGDKVFDSGDDTIQLNFGANYFIDSESDMCAAGLKMAVQANAPPN